MTHRSDNESTDDSPFWETTHMWGESVLFVRPAAGGPARAQLMFTPLHVPRIGSATGLEEYEAGVDYQWTPGSRTITLPAQSRVHAL